MKEFFGNMFGGEKDKKKEYSRDNYEKAEESVKFAKDMVDKGVTISNDMVTSRIGSRLSLKDRRLESDVFGNRESIDTLDVLKDAYDKFVDTMGKRLEEVKKDFEKLKEKGEKEAYTLNKEYDDLKAKMKAGLDDVKEFEDNVVKKFEQEKLGMKGKKEE